MSGVSQAHRDTRPLVPGPERFPKARTPWLQQVAGPRCRPAPNLSPRAQLVDFLGSGHLTSQPFFTSWHPTWTLRPGSQHPHCQTPGAVTQPPAGVVAVGVGDWGSRCQTVSDSGMPKTQGLEGQPLSSLSWSLWIRARSPWSLGILRYSLRPLEIAPDSSAPSLGEPRRKRKLQISAPDRAATRCGPPPLWYLGGRSRGLLSLQNESMTSSWGG